ncbi:MAG: hypothetical protein ABIQ51_04175 [Mesorhizobium sp.]|uniref:hypothetical protein n=1 Tax=Mesorhizobium sp. INR15 TaxID=2654248 RepID=UPI002155FCC4|nr:hypothetical protein [Mesorhizobium sp. INR15]
MIAENWTLQSLIDANMAVTAFCNVAACGHTKTLDLAKLRYRLGPETPAMEWDCGLD